MSMQVRLEDLRKGVDRLLSALYAIEMRRDVPSIHLLAHDKGLDLFAYKDGVRVKVSVPTLTTENFSLWMSGASLLSALAKSNAEVAELKIASSNIAYQSTARTLYLNQIALHAQTEAPPHDTHNCLHASVLLPTALIQAAAQTAAHFADPDPLPHQAAFAGVFFEFSALQTRIAATDGYVLVLETLKGTTISVNNNLIIPAKIIKAFAGAGAERDVVNLTVRELLSHEQTIELATKDVEVVGKAIDRRFVSYEHLFLEPRPNFAIIDRKSLLKAIRPYRAKRYVGMALRFKDGVLFMSAIEAGGKESDNKEAPAAFFQCKHSGPPMRIAFSPQKLLSILEKIETKEIILRMSDPTRPALIEPTSQATNRELIFLIMPCLL